MQPVFIHIILCTNLQTLQSVPVHIHAVMITDSEPYQIDLVWLYRYNHIYLMSKSCLPCTLCHKYNYTPFYIFYPIYNPIYNGAKPEYPCSVFLGAFSVLLHENDEISYTALRFTSIRFSRDAKTATRDASAERIGEIPLRQPCFPDNDAIFAKGCQGARGGSATERNDLHRSSSAHGRQQLAKPTIPKRRGPRCPQAYPAKRPCFLMTALSTSMYDLQERLQWKSLSLQRTL